jgi:hypothetical protein
MPVFTLNTLIKKHIAQRVATLCARPIAVARQDFPLGMATMRSLFLPDTALDALAVLTNHNISLLQTGTVYMHLAPGDALDRDVVLELSAPYQQFFLARHSGQGQSHTHTKLRPDAAWKLDYCSLEPIPGVLSVEEMQALREWAAGVLRAERLSAMAQQTVGQAMGLLDTTAKIEMNWRFLGTLVDPTEAQGYANQAVLRTWQDKLRSGCANPSRHRIYEGMPSMIYREATETLLLQAEFLPAEVPNRRDVIAGKLDRYYLRPGEYYLKPSEKNMDW